MCTLQVQYYQRLTYFSYLKILSVLNIWIATGAHGKAAALLPVLNNAVVGVLLDHRPAAVARCLSIAPRDPLSLWCSVKCCSNKSNDGRRDPHRTQTRLVPLMEEEDLKQREKEIMRVVSLCLHRAVVPVHKLSCLF